MINPRAISLLGVGFEPNIASRLGFYPISSINIEDIFFTAIDLIYIKDGKIDVNVRQSFNDIYIIYIKYDIYINNSIFDINILYNKDSINIIDPRFNINNKYPSDNIYNVYEICPIFISNNSYSINVIEFDK